MDRIEAEHNLKKLFKLDRFYDEQWQAIEKIMAGERVLLIEKTGFGKSLCYQFPATQFKSLTVIFSPLIALMRDQVNYLQSLGINAKCINSGQSVEENTHYISEAIDGKIKILYIAPERQENNEWLEAVRKMKLSMVVIDEAHCISIWGHDFRPAFRRIISLVNLLPKNFPVLATTATATEKVAQDIITQMGGTLHYLRGRLLRDNLHLRVVHVNSEDAKLAWLGEFLRKHEKTGLVYTGTRANTDLYSRWLHHIGISSANYNAGLDSELRKEVEEGLTHNKWRCVVSTNALGMGIDKPDIRYIIHTQIPASPIHYYQEIGRAGRDGLPAYIVLLYNPEDKDLPESFIENNRPAFKYYERVIEALKKEPLGEHDLMRKTNLSQTQIRVIKADLLDQVIIREVMYGRNKKYEYQYNSPELDTQSFERLREFKKTELKNILEYAEFKGCRMQYLCSYLGDRSVTKCGNCDNDLHVKTHYQMDEYWQKTIEEFKNNFFPILEVETKQSVLVNGVASSYYGFSNVGAAIHRCKYQGGGDFPDFLLIQMLRAFRKHLGNEKFDLVVYVPPSESGELVRNFAEKISRTLKIPLSYKLTKIRETKPQKIFQNHVLKRDNIKDAFSFENPLEVDGKSILLIDDIFDSGATIKEIGRLFSHYGANKVAPLVIAKTVGGDIV